MKKATMKRYNVSITRTEYFLIEAEDSEIAVEIAFEESGSITKTPYPHVVDGVQYGTILETDQITDRHDVEEVEP